VQDQDGKAVLNWSTATEQNTKDFIIQHSSNGVDWNNTGRVGAAGNSNTIMLYNYVHTTPVVGVNYYRLLQTDIDGRSSYSQIRSVKFNDGNVSFTVLNNPVGNGMLYIKLSKAANLSLHSNEGKLFWHKHLSAGTVTIDVRGYAKGIYFLKGNGHTEKIIVR
jgi:hypothetical protein